MRCAPPHAALPRRAAGSRVSSARIRSCRQAMRPSWRDQAAVLHGVLASSIWAGAAHATTPPGLQIEQTMAYLCKGHRVDYCMLGRAAG